VYVPFFPSVSPKTNRHGKEKRERNHQRISVLAILHSQDAFRFCEHGRRKSSRQPSLSRTLHALLTGKHTTY
jgi:hypothetical protein